MKEFFKRNISREGICLSLKCVTPPFFVVGVIFYLLYDYGVLRDAIDLYRNADITGLLAFLGLVCGISYAKRKEQFLAYSVFMCGFSFGVTHLLLQLLPEFERSSYQGLFFLKLFLFWTSLGLLLSAGSCAIIAHDIVLKKKER